MIEDEKKEKQVKIDTEEMLEVIQFCGGVSLNKLDEHVQNNLDIKKYDAALGLQVLYELKRDVPLGNKWDPKTKRDKVVIPPNISLRSYVNNAIEYFHREYGLQMELQPIRKK